MTDVDWHNHILISAGESAWKVTRLTEAIQNGSRNGEDQWWNMQLRSTLEICQERQKQGGM